MTQLESLRQYRILAGKLFDPETLSFHENQLITVNPDSGRIVSVEDFSSSSTVFIDSDLRAFTVLPGFVDVHVHFFLHSYDETSWDDQVTKESIVERTVRAVNHARTTLLAGFTSVRDLGTEGAGDSDIHLRKCLSGPSPLTPGPRYFCANRAIIASGSYGPRNATHLDREGVEGVVGAEVADGIDECVKVTRRQMATGADWIKVYADYRVRARTAQINPTLASTSLPTFSPAEIEAIIQTAHSRHVKVAAHAQTLPVLQSLLSLDIDTIEHGSQLGLDDSTLQAFRKQEYPTIWVPTLSVFCKSANSSEFGKKTWESTQKGFKRALELGVDRIACGGDTGAFPHGENALEMKLMVRLGADWKKVLSWGTLGGYNCIKPFPLEGDGSEESDADVWVADHVVKFGCIKPGWAADIIALDGDLEKDFEATLDRVVFVMKSGRVYK